MNDSIVPLAAALVTGLVLSVIYFGGLWITVRRTVESTNPAGLLLLSWFIRTAIVLYGLFVVSRASLANILAFMVGFLVARIFVVRRYGPPPASKVVRRSDAVQS